MHKYDAIFIAPPFKQGNETMWKQFDYFFPPYGLAQIAAFIRKSGYKPFIIDCIVDCPNLLDFREYFTREFVQKGVTADYFGITAVTPIINYALHIAAIVKEYYPESRVVLGGPHPTHLATEVITNDAIDLIVIGEGELTFRDLLDGKPWNEINGLVYKEKNEDGIQNIVQTPEREQIRDLDIIPVPAYDLLNVSVYKAPGYSHRSVPSMSIVTSRGCVGKCLFCSKVFNEVGFRSPASIMEEIRLLYHTYDIRQIIFYDDTFTLDRMRIITLCNMMLSEQLKITWTCFARVDTVDEELLVLMKKAGCEHIMYGVENFNQEVLKAINKQISVDEVFHAVKITQKAGIECRISCMIGNPGESKATIRENIRMIRKLKPDYLQVLIFHPLPGAPIFKSMRKNNKILAQQWEEYNFTKPISIHETLTLKQIRWYYIYMYASFYFSPRFILRELLKLNRKEQWSKIYWGARALLSFFAKNIVAYVSGGKK